MAGPAGLAETTQTFGGAAADLNNDGWPDFFEGHHLAQSQLFQNNNGVFTEIDKGDLPRIPRRPSPVRVDRREQRRSARSVLRAGWGAGHDRPPQRPADPESGPHVL